MANVFMRRCGCGALHPDRQTCTACLDRKRQEAIAKAGQKNPLQHQEDLAAWIPSSGGGTFLGVDRSVFKGPPEATPAHRARGAELSRVLKRDEARAKLWEELVGKEGIERLAAEEKARAAREELDALERQLKPLAHSWWRAGENGSIVGGLPDEPLKKCAVFDEWVEAGFMSHDRAQQEKVRVLREAGLMPPEQPAEPDWKRAGFKSAEHAERFFASPKLSPADKCKLLDAELRRLMISTPRGEEGEADYRAQAVDRWDNQWRADLADGKPLRLPHTGRGLDAMLAELTPGVSYLVSGGRHAHERLRGRNDVYLGPLQSDEAFAIGPLKRDEPPMPRTLTEEEHYLLYRYGI